MDSFVKFFSAKRMSEFEQIINTYAEDNRLEVTAISIVPSHYYGYFEAIVAFRRI